MALRLADQKLAELAGKLSSNCAIWKLYHEHREGRPLPSSKVLGEIIDITRAIVFPGYFGKSNVLIHSLKYPIGAGLQQLYELLVDQILAGLCFSEEELDICSMRRRAGEIATGVIEKLPELQTILATDVEAAYNGDPAAENYGEIISCYPCIRAMTNYRLAHELFVQGVPLIPRILTEMAHSETGIDIHPGATIGHHFTIDHGTGVVIGATCIIGNNVKLYQGVTLSAKKFPVGRGRQPNQGHSTPSYFGR